MKQQQSPCFKGRKNPIQVEKNSCEELGRRHEYSSSHQVNWSNTARKIGFSPAEVFELERLYTKPLSET